MPAVTAGYEVNVANVVPMSGVGDFVWGITPVASNPLPCVTSFGLSLLIRGIFSLVNSSNTTFLGNLPELPTSSGYFANSTGFVCNWLSVLPIRCVVCYCEHF